MRSINFRRAIHRISALTEWLISGWLVRNVFIEVPGPITVEVKEK